MCSRRRRRMPHATSDVDVSDDEMKERDGYHHRHYHHHHRLYLLQTHTARQICLLQLRDKVRERRGKMKVSLPYNKTISGLRFYVLIAGPALFFNSHNELQSATAVLSSAALLL